ncbi:hypothetical protein OIDMADRAFT_56411 [Oidiodendron maius Zn]|uniref:Heterokaryon incompatibility domain-containing protein n=1 Tax=Oidiodendron maius (strain Zn) TaxID=913774 RepID=A0A0C3DBF2_OIDMZ|nr:hypothetical protein OIDMADRAFT_56411 [Oidiodendron maius Zn]
MAHDSSMRNQLQTELYIFLKLAHKSRSKSYPISIAILPPIPVELQGPENEASWANNVTVPKEAAAPLVKFARFENGKLILLEARTDSPEYLAFSHVWGDWIWRDIPGIPYWIKASQGNTNFIENDLPAIVGQVAFWMDTLTVDQSNGKEVIDVVGVIPTIFRHAKRTIAAPWDAFILYGIPDCLAGNVCITRANRTFVVPYVEVSSGEMPIELIMLPKRPAMRALRLCADKRCDMNVGKMSLHGAWAFECGLRDAFWPRAVTGASPLREYLAYMHRSIRVNI